MENVNIIFESIRIAVFNSEIESLKKLLEQNKISPFNMMMQYNNITQEMGSLNDIKHLKQYLTKGGKMSIEDTGRYCSDLYFTTTNQIN